MLEIASYSDIGGRVCNEDTIRYTLREGRRLCLVVADGLGGHGGGDKASSAAADLICQEWNGRVEKEAAIALLKEANRKVLSIQTQRCAMKTTVVLLTLSPEQAVWAHAGDSRLYYFKNGDLTFQTRDHSAAQIGVMLGEITLDQIRFHEDRNRVLRALGQDDELNVETQTRSLGPGKHAFLLCSDGFWEYVLEDEMEEDLCLAQSPQEWLDLMRRRLMKRIPPNNDNNSAAVVWLDGETNEKALKTGGI